MYNWVEYIKDFFAKPRIVLGNKADMAGDARAVNGICRDIRKEKATNGHRYVYFEMYDISAIDELRGLLASRGVRARLHFSRCDGSAGLKRPVMRVPTKSVRNNPFVAMLLDRTMQIEK